MYSGSRLGPCHHGGERHGDREPFPGQCLGVQAWSCLPLSLEPNCFLCASDRRHRPSWRGEMAWILSDLTSDRAVMPVSPALLHSPSVLLSFSSLKSGWVSGGREGGGPKPEEFSECPECWLTQPAGVSHLSQLWWGSASIPQGCRVYCPTSQPEASITPGRWLF